MEKRKKIVGLNCEKCASNSWAVFEPFDDKPYYKCKICGEWVKND